jgi:hypothetical protein
LEADGKEYCVVKTGHVFLQTCASESCTYSPARYFVRARAVRRGGRRSQRQPVAIRIARVRGLRRLSRRARRYFRRLRAYNLRKFARGILSRIRRIGRRFRYRGRSIAARLRREQRRSASGKTRRARRLLNKARRLAKRAGKGKGKGKLSRKARRALKRAAKRRAAARRAARRAARKAAKGKRVSRRARAAAKRAAAIAKLRRTLGGKGKKKLSFQERIFQVIGAINKSLSRLEEKQRAVKRQSDKVVFNQKAVMREARRAQDLARKAISLSDDARVVANGRVKAGIAAALAAAKALSEQAAVKTARTAVMATRDAIQNASDRAADQTAALFKRSGRSARKSRKGGLMARVRAARRAARKARKVTAYFNRRGPKGFLTPEFKGVKPVSATPAGLDRVTLKRLGRIGGRLNKKMRIDKKTLKTSRKKIVKNFETRNLRNAQIAKACSGPTCNLDY